MRALAPIAVFLALLCVGTYARAQGAPGHEASALFSGQHNTGLTTPRLPVSRAQVFFIAPRSAVPDMSGDSGMLAVMGGGRTAWVDTPANRVHNGELLFSMTPEVRGWSRRSPVRPEPTTCTSPSDPRCKISAPSSIPGRFQFEHPDHGVMTAPAMPSIDFAEVTSLAAHPALRVRVLVSDGFIPSPWRPPSR